MRLKVSLGCHGENEELWGRGGVLERLEREGSYCEREREGAAAFCREKKKLKS